MRYDKQIFRKKYILVFLIVLLLLIKLPVLLTSFPLYRESDELAIGAIGKALIDGFVLSPFDYQYTPSDSGNFIVGILAAPFFLLFGHSLFSLKLVALFFQLAILVLLYLLLNRNFNKRVAIFSSLLFILSPQVFTERSLMLQGTHFEPIVFSILAIYIYYKIFFDDKKDNIHFALFGLISGFGVYFSYTFLITLATCFLFWFVFDRRFFLKRRFITFIIFFLIGFSPWIYYNLTHNFRGIIIHGEPLHNHFFKNDLFRVLMNLKSILTYDILHSFQPSNLSIFWNISISYIYYLAFLFSFCVLFWLNRKSIMRLILAFTPLKQYKISSKKEISKETLFLIYPIIFCLIYSLSDFRDWVCSDTKGLLAYRYLIPLFPFILIIISLFLDKIWRKKNRYLFVISFSLVTVLAIIGFASNISLVAFHNFGKVFRQNGFSYDELGRLIGEKKFDSSERGTNIINKFYKKYKALSCYEGIGWRISRQYDVGRFNDLLIGVEKIFWPYCYYGIGEGFSGRYGNSNIEARMIELVLSKVDRNYWPYIIEGLGSGLWLFDERVINLNRFNNLMSNIPGEYKQFFLRGVIRSSFSSNSGYDINRPINLINKFSERYKPYCYEGLGAAIAEIFGDDLNECIRLINSVDEEYRSYCYRGLKTILTGRKIYTPYEKTEI